MKSYSNFNYQFSEVHCNDQAFDKPFLRSKLIFVASFLHSNFCVARDSTVSLNLSLGLLILGTQELVMFGQSLLLLSKDLSTSP